MTRTHNSFHEPTVRSVLFGICVAVGSVSSTRSAVADPSDTVTTPGVDSGTGAPEPLLGSDLADGTFSPIWGHPPGCPQCAPDPRGPGTPPVILIDNPDLMATLVQLVITYVNELSYFMSVEEQTGQ